MFKFCTAPGEPSGVPHSRKFDCLEQQGQDSLVLTCRLPNRKSGLIVSLATRQTPSPLLYALAEAGAVFAVHILVFYLLFDSASLPLGTDGAFHYQLASQLGLSTPWVDIQALPYTLLGEQGPDHHWLIHWLQKPLTVLFGLSPGGMAQASIVWAALVPAAISLLLRGSGVPHAWAIAIVAVWGLFLLPDRFLMLRAQNAAVVMVLALGLLMNSKSYVKVALFVFLFNHAYQGVILAGAIGLSALLAHAFVYREFDRTLLSSALAGFILSLLTSPWFPDNISYFLIVTLGRLTTSVSDLSLMGTEWLPLGPTALFKLGLVGHLSLLCSFWLIFRFGKEAGEKQDYKRALLFAVLAALFLILYARHWRMGEFYGPVAAASLGFSLALVPQQHRNWGIAAMLVALIATAAHQWIKHPTGHPPASSHAGLCQFLDKNAQAGELVFNLPWPSFSPLYGCQPDLKYISGLDGLLLMQGDPEIFAIWYRLNRGQLDSLDNEAMLRTLARTEARFIHLLPGQLSTAQWLLETIPGARPAYSGESGYLISLDRDLLPNRPVQ